MSTIKTWSFQASGSMQILYMFFDVKTTDNGLQPVVFDEDGFDPVLQQLCVKPIVF